MDPLIIFKCFKDRKARNYFYISAIILTVIYVAFSIIIALLTTKPFVTGPILEVILFGWFKAKSFLLPFDWFVFWAFIIVGALLFANYKYWKCSSKASGKAGMIAGLITATCPACILPVLGLTSIAVGFSRITNIIKISLLILLVAATYYVALKQKDCLISKEGKK
jgi:hypothetical protein